MSTWDNFNRLTALSIVFPDNSAAKSATVFGNGKNQVPVLVKVKITDKSGTALDISADELSSAVDLINYSSGEYLTAPWYVSSTPNEYSTPYSYGNSLEAQPLDAAGVQTLTLYVYAEDIGAARNIDVAVRLTIPGVGEFNTTAEGTDTKNGPGGKTGSVFKSPSFIHIKALSEIDYSLSENVKVNNNPTGIGSFRTVVDNMLVIHNNFAGVDYRNYEGSSSKVTATISPAMDGFKFRIGRVASPAVNSGFTLAGGGCDAVWGTSGDHYDATFIFVNKYIYGVLPGNTIHTKCGGEDYYYTIGSGDNRHYWQENLSYGVITVHICNHRTPRSDAHQKGWSDSGKNIRVQVADEFGNSGILSITVSDESWPRLHVNS